MKKIFTLLGIASLAFLYTGNVAHTYSSGAPAGKTGSLGDNGVSCNSSYCHGAGTVTSQALNISVNVIGSTTADVEIMIEAVGSSKIGFQACVEDAFGNKIGEISLDDAVRTKIVGGDYITHTTYGTSAVGQSINRVFYWTAPEDYDGEVIVYAASIFANGNGNPSGDVHLTANYSFNYGVGVEEVDAFEFTVFPNPTSEQINMSWATPLGENTRISLYDMKGAEAVLFEGTLNDLTYTMVLPSHLAKGIYTIKVDSERGSSSRKIVLQ